MPSYHNMHSVFWSYVHAILQAYAEEDSFSCFVRLLSDSVDHFCQQLDNSSVGILSTLSRLTELLKTNDEELWRHLEFTTKVYQNKCDDKVFSLVDVLATFKYHCFHPIHLVFELFVVLTEFFHQILSLFSS